MDETHKTCIVVQPSSGKYRQRDAELHESVQEMVDSRMGGWPDDPLMIPFYRVEQPSVEEWKREWEAGDRF